MKRFFLFLAAVAAFILSGCHNKVHDVVDDIINDEMNTKVDFTYSINGMTVSFVPECDLKVKSYEWFLGDEAMTTTSHPTYTFKTAGTHKVVLRGIWYGSDGNKRTKDCTHEITVSASGGGTQGSKVYVRGFRLDKSIITGFRVKFVCQGKPIFGSDMLNIETPYSTTKITEFPYTYILQSPVLIGEAPNPFDWYDTFTIGAYALILDNEDTRLFEQTFDASLLDGKTEYTISYAEELYKLTLLLEYK